MNIKRKYKSKSKKILLATWEGTGNYGTALQCYALIFKISSLGYDINLINRYKNYPNVKATLFSVLDTLGINKVQRLKNTICANNNIIKSLKIWRFKECFPRENIYTKAQWKKAFSDNNIFLTGSDQIWNAYYSYDPFYFGANAGNSIKIAYGSSMGGNSIPSEHKEEINNYLQEFKCIGVREASTASTLSKLLSNVEIRNVLDPTLLLSAEEWRTVGSRFQLPPMLRGKKYILTYFLGNKTDLYRNCITKISRDTGISNIINLPSAESPELKIDNSFDYNTAGCEDFINLIDKAALVLTDSFHATAFSINLSTEFIAFKRFDDEDKESANIRLYDLLGLFKLTDRLYNPQVKQHCESINYDITQQILSKERLSSIHWLKKAIDND